MGVGARPISGSNLAVPGRTTTSDQRSPDVTVCYVGACAGGDEGDRTLDLRIAKRRHCEGMQREKARHGAPIQDTGASYGVEKWGRTMQRPALSVAVGPISGSNLAVTWPDGPETRGSVAIVRARGGVVWDLPEARCRERAYRWIGAREVVEVPVRTCSFAPAR
jgi:hypothetical protein